jgi:hypothetical protein
MTRTAKPALSRGFVLALILGMFLLALFPATASAHGRRTVAEKYQFIIGFLAEPAFQSQQNGIDLTICNGECKNKADGTLENPVEGVEKTLKAKVIFGSQSMDVTLTPRFRQPGKYNGVFFPTANGEYTFQFTGEVSGTKIDEKFTSGKDGFNSVQSTAPLQFPEKATDVTALQTQIKEAKDAAASANTFGIVGLSAGLVGLIVAVVAVAVAVRGKKPGTATPVESVEKELSMRG